MSFGVGIAQITFWTHRSKPLLMVPVINSERIACRAVAMQSKDKENSPMVREEITSDRYELATRLTVEKYGHANTVRENLAEKR